jgi:16S rRNA (cytidine1402-2'-O)-methyltransferase
MTVPGALYVVATPIGNLEDITLRAVRILREVPHVFAEDTESAYRLFGVIGVRRGAHCYTESRREAGARRVLALLAKGEDVALISEAGTPAVSDPGADLVDRVRAAGCRVVPVPGPSAITALLSVAGKGTERFWFEGYLPRKRGERRRLLESMAGWERPLIFFEAPHRLAEALEDMVECLGGNRAALVARELTKVHEEIRHDTLAGHLAWVKSRPPRGECTLLVHPPGRAEPAAAPDPAALVARLQALMGEVGLSRSRAAARLAQETGLPRKEVYRLGLPESEEE